MRRYLAFSGCIALTLFLAVPMAMAQAALTLPPLGANQKSVVTQYMGMVAVTVTYNSPDVTSPTGDDRTGEIWGKLVPYGLNDLGFGNRKPSPWRVGANENTTFEVSHDVLIEGQPLAAGKYGLHMIAGEDEWGVIFSHDSANWGSFFYEEENDALRVAVKPQKAEFREWLTFDFVDRQLEESTVVMHWEHLQVPIKISVPNSTDLYMAKLQEELNSRPGFNWLGINAAAQYAIQSERWDKALEWSERAVSAPFIGQENFNTLLTRAQALAGAGQMEEAEAASDKAIRHASATANQIHNFGRQLLARGMNDKAVEVFEHNAERFEGAWPTSVGLARGYTAVGRTKEALEHAERALEQAPDDLNRNNLRQMIEQLKQSQSSS